MNLLKNLTHSGSHDKDKEKAIRDENWLVTVERAEGVEDKDRWTKSDTYAIIEFGDQKVRTHTINNSRTPFWNETFNLKVRADYIKDFHVRLMDDDFGPDDPIGTAVVSRQDLPFQLGEERYLRIPLFRKEQATGSIILRIKRFDNLDNTTLLTTTQEQPLSTSQQQPKYIHEQPLYTSQQQPQYTHQPSQPIVEEPHNITTSQPHDVTIPYQSHNITTSQPHNTTTSQPQDVTIPYQSHNITTSQPHDITIPHQPHNITTSQPHDITIPRQPHNTTTSQPHVTTSHQPHNITTSQPYNTQPHNITTSHKPRHTVTQYEEIIITTQEKNPSSHAQVSQQPNISGIPSYQERY